MSKAFTLHDNSHLLYLQFLCHFLIYEERYHSHHNPSYMCPSIRHFKIWCRLQNIVVGKRVPTRINNSNHVTCWKEVNAGINTFCFWCSAKRVLWITLPDLQVIAWRRRGRVAWSRLKGEEVYWIRAIRNGGIADLRLRRDQAHAVCGESAIGDVKFVGRFDAIASAGC